MKQGMQLQELATEIQRQARAKVDYLADTTDLEISLDRTGEGPVPQMFIRGAGFHGMTKHLHSQLSERLKIPAAYYKLMLEEAPDLLAHNINHWFETKPARRMVRTLDGDARAFLSNRYRPLDNHDLADAVLPVLTQGGVSVHSAQITPEKLYIKAVLNDVQVTVEPPPGAPARSRPVRVSPGIVIQNSEVGMAQLQVLPAIHDQTCFNLATWARAALQQVHLGKALGGGGDQVLAYLSDDTKRLSDAALWSAVKDTAQGALHPQGKVFQDILGQLGGAMADSLGDNLQRPVERLAKSENLTEGEQQGILAFLVDGGDVSRWGLSSAITRYSQDVEDYGRATELEELGGEVVALSRLDFRHLVN